MNSEEIAQLRSYLTSQSMKRTPLQSKYPAPSADAVALRWSPDGSHLLLSSVASGLVSLWKFDW